VHQGREFFRIGERTVETFDLEGESGSPVGEGLGDVGEKVDSVTGLSGYLHPAKDGIEVAPVKQ
jgi:hypothetical protein